MGHWAVDSIFYAIYPLGFCGAPEHNDFASPAVNRLSKIASWAAHLQKMGVNAVYLGPVFESSSHGYDTADYFRVDCRLGDNAALSELASGFHRNGMRLILDGVFNHVGRDFWAFQDVLKYGPQSAFCSWFQGLNFEKRSPYNDPFTYESWNGYYELVKLNLSNPAVKDYLFQAVAMWMREFQIDGLRLDTADCLELDFLKDLAAFCHSRQPDFWLMGETIHGDYRRWVNPQMLDSVTNYEGYKGLYSSHVDKNYFEIAYSLNRQFGKNGIYRGLALYNFADNHDVNRVASSLTNPAHLHPLYCLLFTMPGIPSIYYGSEWGLEGRKIDGRDQPLRPSLDLASASQSSPHPELAELIAHLAQIRHNSPALRYGNYRQLFVSHEQLAFARQASGESVLVLVNASERSVSFDLEIPPGCSSRLVDLLNPPDTFQCFKNKLRIDSVAPYRARILLAQ
jgi:cyclomaltodextrinase / maltogenic alpha-amylase / neopullulanase